MDQKSIFYVYVLFDQFGIPRYVGKGRGDRWHHHEIRKSKNYPKNAFIRETMRALGEIPKVKLRESLSEQEAFDTEIALIAAIGRMHIRTGSLTNLTDGGEGMVGYKFSRQQLTARNKAVSAGHMRHSSEARSERARQRELKRSVEERKASALKRVLSQTPEERSLSATNGGKAAGLLVHINNKLEGRRIALGSPLPTGWSYGRLYTPPKKFLTCAVNTRWINDGQSTKRLAATEPLPDGWSYGRKPNTADAMTSHGSRAPSATITSLPALPSSTVAK